jgi:hypothetical protein
MEGIRWGMESREERAVQAGMDLDLHGWERMGRPGLKWCDAGDGAVDGGSVSRGFRGVLSLRYLNNSEPSRFNFQSRPGLIFFSS